MAIQKLAGYLCIFALCLTNHLCSARKGEIRRRFMNNFGVPVCHHCVHGQCTPNDVCICHHGWTGQGCDKLFGASSNEYSQCGLHYCVHGVCSYSMMNGLEKYHTCNCHLGWKGDACDIAVDHVDHCKNHCIHGTCVSNSNMYGYHCECDHGWEGGHCEVQSVHQIKTTVVTVPTTTIQTTKAFTPSTTSSHSTQTTAQAIKYTCNKLAVVENIAMSVHMNHPNSSPCVSGDGGFDDAYVLSACNTTSPNTWRAGANVMADCRSSTHLIPPFTPISTFSYGVYFSLGAQSGIFLECYNNNIKMAVQKCDGVPEIILIDTGVLVDNQKSFYVVV